MQVFRNTFLCGWFSLVPYVICYRLVWMGSCIGAVSAIGREEEITKTEALVAEIYTPNFYEFIKIEFTFFEKLY